jgi:hypothetical protein
MYPLERIFDPHNFARFMEYEGETYDEFIEAVSLAKVAVFDETSREILNEKSLESIEYIKNKSNNMDYSTSEFTDHF